MKEKQNDAECLGLYEVTIRFRRDRDIAESSELVDATVYVATGPSCGGAMLDRVGDIACERIVGPRGCWSDYMPTVESIRFMPHSVWIDMDVIDQIRRSDDGSQVE